MTTTPGKVIELSGAMTVREVARLQRTFLDLAAERTDATLGLRAVTELDGAGLQLLLALGRALEDGGRTLRLAGVGGAVELALRESGGGKYLDHDTGVDA